MRGRALPRLPTIPPMNIEQLKGKLAFLRGLLDDATRHRMAAAPVVHR